MERQQKRMKNRTGTIIICLPKKRVAVERMVRDGEYFGRNKKNRSGMNESAPLLRVFV